MIETRGRVSGRTTRTAVGYVEEPDGSFLVAAGSSEAHWARNLEAHPAAVVELDGRRLVVQAEPLDDDGHVRAVRDLILRYGTPAEPLGSGPSFRLRPVPGDPVS